MKGNGRGTLRKQITSLLELYPSNSIEISQKLGISEKEVVSHLPHIARSVRTSNKRLLVRQSPCIHCGHEFKKRKRLTRPGRCPRCRKTRIKKPVYEIR